MKKIELTNGLRLRLKKAIDTGWIYDSAAASKNRCVFDVYENSPPVFGWAGLGSTRLGSARLGSARSHPVAVCVEIYLLTAAIDRQHAALFRRFAADP
ncbi:unnamed protein product [Soboliphyme baturini]|uniref:Type II toxin-antitoxin system RelE/ParE family toxin n=1 Tax=Soboliphyme baturini TaxID=241478 RepID=A0A183IYX5_9BILA|nr:unnamed protein product [Soboliphyme baturini]